MRMLKGMVTAVAVGISFLGMSQIYLGVTSSNFAGVMGTDVNPASFVDGRFKVDVNLGSFSFNSYTNAGYLDTKQMPKWWIKSFKPDVNPNNELDTYYMDDNGSKPNTNSFNDWAATQSGDFDDAVLTRNYFDLTSDKTVGFYNVVQVDALNFMFHINRNIAVGAKVKYRSVTNLDDVDPHFANLLERDFLKDSTDAVNYASALWNNPFNEELLDFNHMSWMEYGINYSQVIMDKNEHFLKGGVNLKFLAGYTAAYIHTNNFDYEVLNDSVFSSVRGDFSYGHSAGILEEMGGGNPVEFNPTQINSKLGIGGDIGFIYEWRPDWKDYKYDMDGETNLWHRDLEKYTLRAGVSIMDIGGIKYQKGSLSQDFTVNATNFDFREPFRDDKTLAQIDSSIQNLIDAPGNGISASSTDEETFYMQLPTSIGLQLDYHIYKWFYVNASGVINVQNRKNPHRVRNASQVSLTPMFDHSWYGLGIPISYNSYSGFKAGLGARLGPLTIGVTDFRALFASGKVRGAEIYTGLRLPILYVHPSDIDGDKVSDKLDSCLVVPGLWEFRGCPDSDRDGIKDLDDHCPNEPGLLEFNGCPDKDMDGLPDKDDACPDDAGPIEFNGCPDKDDDKIIDKHDDCPDVPGLAKFNGCPDTDGDGIKDEDDACPDVPGPEINNGCPDTDGDGLFDFIDECPTEFGPKENNGCPWPDTDGDGLLDKDDKCPYIAGPRANDGCPYQDTDNDGVLDKDDKCPNTPGPVSNQGCPEIEKEVAEILKTAFENLEFETGKDIIKPESIPSLTELAQVLVKRPEWKLQIAGHTDNVGNDQANLVLSKKRAEAVKNFMISQGIDASRLSALYFGETMPIASNDTPEGRQKNRRVEMTIIFE